LVGAHLAFDACRLYPVRYRLRAVLHPFGELHQFPVQVRACRVRILRVYGALYVRGHCAVRTLCLFQMQNCISHNCNTFFRLILPCLVSMPHGSGVSKGAASLLLIGAFLAMCALREEKALMSYGFFKAFR